MPFPSGHHFLQIPGPTNVPGRILRAVARPTIDHRGPEFRQLAREVLDGLKEVFQCSGPVVVYPSSGTGAWEAALTNTLSPGDTVLMSETGHFAALWCRLARRLGLKVVVVPGDWRLGVDPALVQTCLAEDRQHYIKAVCIVHNETSTGVANDIQAIRRAIEEARHPALYLVDTISSLASMDYRHDEWSVDVTVGCSQKGLMLPPGLGFNAISEKALQLAKQAQLHKGYWDWDDMLSANAGGFFPYTPATNLLFGLQEALIMIREEGLPGIFARHDRLAEATRRAVRAWDLEIFCAEPAKYSSSLTAVVMPKGHDADVLRSVIHERCNMSLGAGLGKLKGQVFRIGHLGDFNDLMLAGTLAGVEMGMKHTGVPHRPGGITAALDYLSSSHVEKEDLSATAAVTA
ncbi:MAG: pyridoxal-phosphate-dependent aminotransferase family protein [Alphaproteobacteria bacterium]